LNARDAFADLPPFVCVSRACCGALKLGDCSVAVAGFREERPADEVRVGIFADALEEREARARSFRARDCEGPVHADRRCCSYSLEACIELGDLAPVGRVCARRTTMHCRDRRFDLQRPWLPDHERRFHERRGLRNRRRVPAPPILLGQRHRRAARIEAGAPSRFMQHHEREQTQDLRVLRKRLS
jgi:hypothetical protein